MRAQTLHRGRYVARLATGEAEIVAAQALRHRAFRAARGRDVPGGRDADDHDLLCRHMLVLDGAEPIACYRLRLYAGEAVLGSYSAQHYDLWPLRHFPQNMLELGRFCLDPERHDPDILRLAWAAMARIVDAESVGLLFGCSSFPGADAQRHAAALSALRLRIGPDAWRPRQRAGRDPGQTVALSGLAAPFSAAQALAGTPPLLRTYIGMGGWVSDHAVLDAELDTLHVFTGVEIAAIPPGRARALRQIAAESVG